MVVGGKSAARGKIEMASSSAEKNGRNGWREIAAKISGVREESVVVLCRGRQRSLFRWKLNACRRVDASVIGDGMVVDVAATNKMNRS